MLDALHVPTLYFTVILVMLTAATVMSMVGLTQRTYRGYWWWVLAQWLNLGSALALLVSAQWPWGLPLSVLLSLQWPTTMLTGLRRFYVRSDLPFPEYVDRLLVAVGTLWWFFAWTHYPEDPSHRVTAFTVSSMACYIYTAWMIFSIRERKQSALLKMLMVFMVVGVLVQIPRLNLALGNAAHDPKELLDLGKHAYLLIAMMCAVIFAVYIGMLLTYERTEQELIESQRQLRAMVDLDMLTQLPNRRHFMDMAQQTVRMAPPDSCSLMMIDIAGFKHINETYGHAAGESALRLVSSAARRLLRGRDLVGRLGADQFAALLPDTSSQDALHVADRMHKQVAHLQSRSEREHVLVNIAIVQLLEHDALEPALQKLTEALHESEHLGRGRVIQVNTRDGGIVALRSANAVGTSAG